MISMNRTIQIPWLIMAGLMSTAVLSSCQAVNKKNVLNSPVDENTAVRFFYNPAGDYFHFPLVFRAVGQKDPRLNTAPMLIEGRTAYISFSEMQQLMQGLARSGLLWRQSEKVEVLRSFKVEPPWVEHLEITVVSSKGTARASLDPKNICETLKRLDSALKTPRALWEFQRLRLNYDCKVPGFIYDAYPDHY